MATISTGSTPSPKAEPVHFTEAIDYLRQKITMPTRAYTDLWQDQHARAFVVAGAMRDALVTDFHVAVTKALAEGRTLQDFRKDFDRIVAAHGWSYKGSAGWRSATIYNVNLRSARSAGRWAQAVRLAQTQKIYLRYVAVMDDHTRPEHRAWHGIILPLDHPWWRTHMPLNGWGCRCDTMIVTERALKRYGWRVTRDDELPLSRVVDHEIMTPEGPVTVQAPEGIDPGFAYNPGEGVWGRGPQMRAIREHGPFDALEAPSSMLADAGRLEPVAMKAELGAIIPPLADGTPDEPALRKAFREAIGGDEAIFTDPTGTRVAVTQALLDHILENPAARASREPYWPFIRELVEEPQEIWVGFSKSPANGRVALRRRYIRVLRLGKDRAMTLVTDEQDGFWQGWTFFRGRPSKNLANMRRGVKIYPEAGS